MNKKDFPISIPLRDHRMKQITGVVQNDVGSNRLILTLLDGNTPFDYTGYTNITFTVQKPNGTVYMDSLGERIRAVSPKKGQIEIVLGEGAVETAGNHTAVVELYSSDVRMTSARFAYSVVSDLAAVDDPEIENTLPVLQNLINDVTELEESVGAAESARVSAEEGRASAESGRVQAEEGRVSAENQRESAESARQTAEAQRQANETARVSAESARASAESARVSAEANRNTVFAQKTEAAENAAAAANAAAQEAEAAAQEAGEAVEGLESWKGDFTTQEAQRQANEAIRQSNETARTAAENTRNSAETQRSKAEAGRVSAEKQRESAESAREAAESARVQAENQRINTFAEEVAQAEAAREAAQGARTAAETAKTLAETAQANAEAAETGAQGYAQAAQSSASAASGSKDAAVLAAQGAESSANAAASAKTDAEAAKTAAETAQTNAESAASSAAQSESNAAQSAQAASGSATAAESAKTAAQTAQGAAETAKSNAEASATAAAGSQAQAASSAATANASAVNAQSWAVGGTGTREGENTNNAKYWCESAAAAAGGGVTSFNGRSGAVAAQAGDYDAGMVGADPAGTAASAVSTHNAAADAHSSLFGGKADVNHSHDGVYQPAGSYLTSETDPTVPAWAKAAAKPAYTASEVGADTAGSAAAVQSNLDGHTGNTANPHSVTKDQVGLGNVDNTSDADKPVSTATQTALNGKSNTDHNHAGVYQPVGSYLTSETDPTVPAWAKAATKPAYTAAEVGADAAGSAAAVQSNLDAHTGNTANPHNVTAAQVGAAASVHYHAASDITSGTLSITRGGTGVTSIGGTDYTTTRFRGSQLRSADTTPTTNGTINWTYE